jgi:hypothetical protein
MNLLSSELRNNSRALLTLESCNTDINELENQDILCMAYQNGIIKTKEELQEEIEKEDFDYPISLFDENTEYESQEELFKAIASKDVDDGEGNFRPESQEYDENY